MEPRTKDGASHSNPKISELESNQVFWAKIRENRAKTARCKVIGKIHRVLSKMAWGIGFTGVYREALD